MKVKDLMIGDWVYRNGKDEPMKVLTISEHGCCLGFTDGYCGESEDLIEPIPITPEILEKNGFVCADLPFEDFYTGYGLSIYGGDYADGHSNWYIICGINVSMNVTHVHELQHALKLCEIEKEIIL